MSDNEKPSLGHLEPPRSPFFILPAVPSPHKGPAHCSFPPFLFSSKVGQRDEISTFSLLKKKKSEDGSGLNEWVTLGSWGGGKANQSVWNFLMRVTWRGRRIKADRDGSKQRLGGRTHD